MTRIYDIEVNKIAECNLRYDITNHPKLTKILNIHYYPIIHGCMNTRRNNARFKNFQTLLDSGCSSVVLMGVLVENYVLKKML